MKQINILDSRIILNSYSCMIIPKRIILVQYIVAYLNSSYIHMQALLLCNCVCVCVYVCEYVAIMYVNVDVLA